MSRNGNSSAPYPMPLFSPFCRFLHISIIGRTSGRSQCGSLTRLSPSPQITPQSLSLPQKFHFSKGKIGSKICVNVGLLLRSAQRKRTYFARLILTTSCVTFFTTRCLTFFDQTLPNIFDHTVPKFC